MYDNGNTKNGREGLGIHSYEVLILFLKLYIILFAIRFWLIEDSYQTINQSLKYEKSINNMLIVEIKMDYYKMLLEQEKAEKGKK